MIISEQGVFNKFYPKEVTNLIHLVSKEKPHKACIVFTDSFNNDLELIRRGFADLKTLCTTSVVMEPESPGLKDLSQEVFDIDVKPVDLGINLEEIDISFDNLTKNWRTKDFVVPDEKSSLENEAFDSGLNLYTSSSNVEENETLPLGQTVEEDLSL